MADEENDFPDDTEATPSISGERPEAVTKVIKLGDREVLCRMLTEAQFMQLAYETKLMTNNSISTDRKVKTLERIFRVMRSVVATEEDKEYLEDLVAEGVVDMYDLLHVIEELNKEYPDKKQLAKVSRGPVTPRSRRK